MMNIINDVLVDKLFKDPPKMTKEIPLLSEKTVSGDGMIVINDAYSDFPIKNLTLQGNTKQDSATGAQLFDISSATIGAVSRTTGENLEYGANWKRSDYIQVVSGQQYSCTYAVNYQDTGFAFYDEQKTFLSGIPCTKNFTVPESAVFCRITVNTTNGNPNIFMFNAGSTALPWEPYTGGKPSPSPDYPQEIKNVGKWNEETQKYEVDVMVTNAEQDWDKEQSLTITSDRPITKWDKLVEQDGQIGWLYKAVFDSDVRPSRMDLFPSGFSLYKDHLNGVFTYKARFAKKEIGWQTSICKQFKNVDGSYSKGELFYYSDQPSIDSVYFNSNIATLESFVKWMEENPLEIVYKSRESEFIPLQQSEQAAIRALTTYHPTTVITVDGGELPVGIEVTYMKPEYIPTKQSALRMWFKENPII